MSRVELRRKFHTNQQPQRNQQNDSDNSADLSDERERPSNKKARKGCVRDVSVSSAGRSVSLSTRARSVSVHRSRRAQFSSVIRNSNNPSPPPERSPLPRVRSRSRSLVGSDGKQYQRDENRSHSKNGGLNEYEQARVNSKQQPVPQSPRSRDCSVGRTDEMEDKDDTVEDSLAPMPANKLDVVYLNGVRDARSWDEERLRREVKRVFPQVVCRAKCLGNGGIMLYSFQFDSDLRLVQSTDWTVKVGDSLPFGGVKEARKDRFLSRETLARTVRLRVRKDSRAPWVTEILKEEKFGECVVEEIGEPRYGFRTLKIILESQELAQKITADGVRIGDSLSVPEHWQYASGTKLCTFCWRHHDTRRACPRPRVCGKCSKAHVGRCQDRFFKCPNCSCEHSVYSRQCSYRHELYRRFSERTGLPLPRFVNSANVDVPLAHVVEGQSFAAVASQRKSVSSALSQGSNYHRSAPNRNEVQRPNALRPREQPQPPAEPDSQRPSGQGAHHNQPLLQPRNTVPRDGMKQIIAQTVETHLKPVLALLVSVIEMLKITAYERVSTEEPMQEEPMVSDQNDDMAIVAESSRQQLSRAKRNEDVINVGRRPQSNRGRRKQRAGVNKGGQQRSAICVSPSPDERSHRKAVGKAARDLERISALEAELAALKKSYEESPDNND